MLQEYKQLYLTRAEQISDFKSIDKNELCRQYVENHDDAYLSAIIYDFWYILTGKISLCKNKYISDEDIYDIYIESIMQMLEEHIWDNEHSTIYKDKKGPERALNTIFKSRIINYFVASTRQKRKLHYNTISLESEVVENILVENSLLNDYNELEMLIKNYFKTKDYIKAYIVDIILNNSVFSYDEDNNEIIFNKKKLKHYLANINDDYCEYFSTLYGVNLDEVKNSVKYVEMIPNGKFYEKIDWYIYEISKNETLKQILNR